MRSIMLAILLLWGIVPLGHSAEAASLYEKAQPLLQQAAQQEHYAVSVRSIRDKQLRGEQPIIIDIRSKTAYEAGHIPGALSIPLKVMAQQLKDVPDLLPLNQTVYVVCCPKDINAAFAVLPLRLAGYQAYFIAGGVGNWQEQGYPLAEGAPEPIRITRQALQPDCTVLDNAETFWRGFAANKGYRVHEKELQAALQGENTTLILDVGGLTNYATTNERVLHLPLEELAKEPDVWKKKVTEGQKVYVLDENLVRAAMAVALLRVDGIQAWVYTESEEQ